MADPTPIYAPNHELQGLRMVVETLIERLDDAEERIRELEVNQPTPSSDLTIEDYGDYNFDRE